MLTVKYGSFHPELETAFAARLRELAPGPGGRPVAVVAPSRRLAERLERLAAVEGGLSLLNVHFHTFYSLALSVVEEAGFPPLRLVGDPVFHDRLVDSLLDENRALGLLFGGGLRPRALARALRASLRDLIDAGVSFGEVEEHFGSELLSEPRERERLSALLRLAEAYEGRLEKLGVLSPSGLVRLAAGRAEESPFLGRFGEILYYGFYDLTGLQLEFFEAVTARHPATLFFPYRKGRPAFRFADDFFEQKLMGSRTEELPPAPAAKPALSVISASGAKDEVWAAVKEILRLVESGACGYEDIGLAARTLEPYRALIAEVFAENGVPCGMPGGEPLLRRPLAKAALNLLALKRRDYPAAAVEDLFSSPYFAGGEGFGLKRARHWKLLIRRLGIHAGFLQWEGKLERRGREDLELYPERAREGGEGYAVPKEDVRALWALIAELDEALGRPEKSWKALARSAREILDRRLRLPEEPRAAESAALDAVREALSSFETFDLLGRAPTWDDFLECLEEKLAGARLDLDCDRRGVRVRDAMGARGESFRVLFLIGLKEKLFPRPVLEDPLLRDSARAVLRHPAGYWIGRKAAGTEEERLLFHLLVASAREKLYCVYPRSDEEGKAQVPSLYLRELCRERGLSLADEKSCRRVARQPAEKLRACEPGLLSEKEFSLRLALEGRSAAEPLAAAGRDGTLLESAWESVRALNAPGGPGAFDGIVGRPQEYLDRLRRRGISPSALESFAQCPFQYFADRVLGLGRREEAAEKGEFAAWTRGKIYHAVLERFYADPDPGSDWEARLSSVVERTFGEYGWKELGVYPVLWLAAKQKMAANLRSFVAWDLGGLQAAGLRPAWLEKELEAPLPGRLPAGLEGLSMRGVVDRVDMDSARRRYRIVDYKTRWRKPKPAGLIAKGILYQLPVYAELAAQAMGDGAVFEGAHLYLLEDSPESTGTERAQNYDAAQWAKDRGPFFERVSAQVEEIAQGRYPIRPEDGEFGYCRLCDFAAMCRKGHAPTRRRAFAEVPRG